MKVGWIGTGVMGKSMAGHVQAGGHDLFVYNRTKAKADDLLKKGAAWCNSPVEVAEKSEILFSIVGLPRDVEETYLGKNGVLSAKGSCRIIVDMTTSRPSLAQIIEQEAAKKGVESLDAPVSGGDIGARDGTLAIMVGGKKGVFEEVLPVFQVMGRNIAYMGDAGAGQNTKMANQILVAGTMIGVCESLLYAVKLGLDPQAVIDIISKGAAGSWSISNLGPRLVRGDFKTGFLVRHFIKDMGIALQEAGAVGLSMPGLALVHQLYVAAMAQGHGDCTTQALYLALKSLNGMR
ncbi:MAG: NAD(P)-dependent oxidoreductase [Desulfobacterota bacterium]|nr:NAD(P)-dependent oxidoreductase [Thermodesulfobacteriota bacterium]